MHVKDVVGSTLWKWIFHDSLFIAVLFRISISIEINLEHFYKLVFMSCYLLLQLHKQWLSGQNFTMSADRSGEFDVHDIYLPWDLQQSSLVQPLINGLFL